MDNRRISEMRNLGPACEEHLNAVGIMTAEDVHDLGVEETFLRMLAGRSDQSSALKCCNAAYMYALYGAIHDIAWQDVPEAKKNQFKKFTAELRASGRFG